MGHLILERALTPGEKIPVVVDPLQINSKVLEDADIELDTKKIRSNRSGGPSGMRAEHLRCWLAGAWDENTYDITNWLKVVELVHTASHNG